MKTHLLLFLTVAVSAVGCIGFDDDDIVPFDNGIELVVNSIDESAFETSIVSATTAVTGGTVSGGSAVILSSYSGNSGWGLGR